MKTLVVFYSQSGNTEIIAKKVAQTLNADIEAIEPDQPYEGNYQRIVCSAHDEVENDFKRPINSLKCDLSSYERIVIGTPVWWGKIASPVLTFLSDNDFSGKIVVPFITDAGCCGTAIDKITSILSAKGAIVANVKEFVFDTNNDGTTTCIITPEKELNKWIDSLCHTYAKGQKLVWRKFGRNMGLLRLFYRRSY